jgi:hypothetical protein
MFLRHILGTCPDLGEYLTGEMHHVPADNAFPRERFLLGSLLYLSEGRISLIAN